MGIERVAQLGWWLLIWKYGLLVSPWFHGRLQLVSFGFPKRRWITYSFIVSKVSLTLIIWFGESGRVM